MSPTPNVEQKVYKQSDQPTLVGDPNAKVFRKHARVLAVQQDKAFLVYTDRGPMQGMPGDWLVTNHPDDDPGSDLWAISNERMTATYDPGLHPHPGDQHVFATACLTCGELGQLNVSIIGPNEKVSISEV